MAPEPNGTIFIATKRSILVSLLIIGLLPYCLTLLSQEIQHDVSVINIEVPVRVFKGDAFVDNLTIGEFDVYEDGKLQKIEAVYLIKKTNIQKREETKTKFSPEVSRHFVLAFELNEYLPKIEEALNYFFDNIIVPGDTLNVVTPVKTYNFKSEALAQLPKQKIAGQLKEKLRNDITLGNSEYRSLMKSLEDIFILEVEPDLKQLMYLETARKLRDLKFVDQQKLVGFADFLKNMTGQKYVFMFYQKELIPVLPGIEDFYLAELRKDISLDIEKIRQAFSDSSISVHFLFVTNKPGMHDNLNVGRMQPLRVELFDQSDSIFSAFKEVANATGGITDSSANAAASFQKAADASENYYLIYYLPKDYKVDGKFREIEVKVKNKNYTITHRAGYFAN
jgi:VWFA-related protein